MGATVPGLDATPLEGGHNHKHNHTTGSSLIVGGNHKGCPACTTGKKTKLHRAGIQNPKPVGVRLPHDPVHHHASKDTFILFYQQQYFKSLFLERGGAVVSNPLCHQSLSLCCGSVCAPFHILPTWLWGFLWVLRFPLSLQQIVLSNIIDYVLSGRMRPP